ncbi:CBO0543 family protein [Neobacillus sp. GCM10023253]|uniref:CBO0543 family protein n=1 Tax=Neobacillus sp. GCM10023253 TaxID=3252644 RepID=UPI003608F090
MEVTFLYAIWSVTIFSLVLIPRKRVNEASVIFLFQQLLTWSFGLLVAEWNLIEYPVREFASVNRTSFTFEFLVYPVISIFYVLYYPVHKSIWQRILYTAMITTVLIISEVLFEKFTNLIKYIHWEWYVSWISVYATLYIAQRFHRWFFKFG